MCLVFKRWPLELFTIQMQIFITISPNNSGHYQRILWEELTRMNWLPSAFTVRGFNTSCTAKIVSNSMIIWSRFSGWGITKRSYEETFYIRERQRASYEPRWGRIWWRSLALLSKSRCKTWEQLPDNETHWHSCSLSPLEDKSMDLFKNGFKKLLDWPSSPGSRKLIGFASRMSFANCRKLRDPKSSWKRRRK